MVVAEMLAERYGWTMTEIKNLPREEVEALVKIIGVKNKLNEQQRT